jgi:hypothetical protein
VNEIEIVVAHRERTTLRVGDMFLKIDSDPARLDVEVAAMTLAPLPTAEILWRRPSVLALAALPGEALGVLGAPSTASPAAWSAAGAAIRALHDAPLPPWPTTKHENLAAKLEAECDWLVTSGTLPPDLVARNRDVAAAALQPRPPVFAHGDLQITHIFTADDKVTGVLDWSEGGQGNAMADLATLTLGHEDRLPDVIAGYGADRADADTIRGWWSLRSLLAIQWLLGHGFDAFKPGCEVDVLRARM